MKFNNTNNLVICLAVSLLVPISTSNAQTINRIFKSKSMDDLDPSAIESEIIDSMDSQTKELPIFRKASTQKQTGSTTETQSFQKPSSNFGNSFPKSNFNKSQSSFDPTTSVGQTKRLVPEVKNLPAVQFDNSNTVKNTAPNRRFPTSQQGTYESKSTPTIQTQIIAPKSIIVDQTARFMIQAVNVGRTNVSSVKLVVMIPEHAKFVSAVPQPTNVNGQKYEFTLNSLNANARQNIQLDVVPTEKLPLTMGTEIQIVAQQQFAVSVQQPILKVTVDSPETVLTGKTVQHQISVTNIGDGIAEAVRINAQRPEQLEVGKEPQKTLVPKLAPGQSTKFVLSSYAITEGNSNIFFQVSAKGAELQRAKAAVNVVRPELGVQMLGPSQNYLGRDGTYSIQLRNTGKMPVTKVAVELQVPKGLAIEVISKQASINPTDGKLSWTFDSIPGQQLQTIQFKAKSIAIGNQVCRVKVQTQETASKQMALGTKVMGRADLSIRVYDAGAPVGVGSESDFQIEVSNHGSQNAENVAVRVELPAGLMPITQPSYSVDNASNFITFKNATVEAGKRKIFKFKVEAVTQGEHIVRGTVSTNGSTQLSSENSIFVFESANAKVSEALLPDVRR